MPAPTTFFTGRMPFLPPNQQRQSTEGIPVKNWRILSVQSFTVRMPLLTATGTFRLGRRRWSSRQQCYLHCLHTLRCSGSYHRRIKSIMLGAANPSISAQGVMPEGPKPEAQRVQSGVGSLGWGAARSPPATGLRECCKLPQWGPAPAAKRVSCTPEAPDGLSWNSLGPSSGGGCMPPRPLPKSACGRHAVNSSAYQYYY